MDNNNTARGGIGLFGALGIAFIVLKLCGVINWAWWIVLAPFWAPIATVALVFIVLFVIELIRG